MKAIVTVIGKDQVGITAAVCSLLDRRGVFPAGPAQHQHSGHQPDHFTGLLHHGHAGGHHRLRQVHRGDLPAATACDKSIVEISQLLEDAGSERNLSIRIQREDIFNAMHRI